MTATISTIIVAALGSVGAYFTWKSSAARQRKQAEADIAKETAELEAKKQEIRVAVYNHDDERLNQIVKQLMED